MTTKLYIIILILLFIGKCFSQNSSDSIYLSYKGITDISIKDRELWACVEKGFIKVDFETEKTTFYSRANYNLPVIDLKLIEVDENNTIWLGTGYDGLFRLQDGQIEHFTKENSKLTSNNIRSLELGMDGILWVGTEEGIVKIDNRDIEILPDSPNAESFFFQSKDELWCGTIHQGLWHFSKGNWKQFTPDNSLLPDYTVRDFLIDKNGRKWVATDNGLYIFEGKGLKKIVEKHLETNWILDLEQTKTGKIWIATYDGLHTIINDSLITYNKSNSSLIENYIWILKSDDQNNLWMGTEGLMKYEDSENSITSILPLELIPSNYIRKVKAGENNTTWLGTYENGIIKYENGKWQNYTSSDYEFLGNYIEYLYIDKDQNIWIASSDSEVSRTQNIVKFDGKNWSNFPVKTDRFIIDFDNNIWFVKNYQLHCYNTHLKSLKIINLPVNNFMASSESLSIDDQGDIWISSKYTGEQNLLGMWHDVIDPKGIAKISANDTLIFYESNQELEFSNQFDRILHNNKGETFGFDYDKIYKLNGQKWKFYLDLSSVEATCSKFDKNGILWIGTMYHGLMCYDNDKWITYNPSNSLVLNKRIMDIDIDNNNNLWISTRNGLTFMKNTR
ncbi:MAG: hypothetical protein OEW67_14745 [Cyclobacteriaceae bacterium]|nr:hypothetical protein [Cyclobacteriaceae bacterium]